MLVTTQCASYCRYCTRSRIVGDPTQNFNRREHEAQLDYLRRTPQVRDVLISGGDGLTLAPKLFESILRGLREIPHIEIIRIGSRVPVFLPQRIDDELCAMLEKYHPLWINLHFNHPNEITPEVSRAVDKLTKAGLPVGNQSVLLAGVNDCVHIQRALVHRLVENRIRPYYLYQCDLVEGSGHFRTPVGKGLEIMEGLRGHTSGYAVPTYVIDAPGGGGKIPVMPNYLISYSDHKVVLRNYEGYITTYEEPPTYKRHDEAACAVLPARAAGAGPVGRARAARGRADVDRAEGLRGGPHPRQHRGAPAPGPVEVGAVRGRRDRGHVGAAAAASSSPATPADAAPSRLVPARSPGRATASRRLRPRRAALADAGSPRLRTTLNSRRRHDGVRSSRLTAGGGRQHVGRRARADRRLGDAGLIDAATAERLRAAESRSADDERRRDHRPVEASPRRSSGPPCRSSRRSRTSAVRSFSPRGRPRSPGSAPRPRPTREWLLVAGAAVPAAIFFLFGLVLHGRTPRLGRAAGVAFVFSVALIWVGVTSTSRSSRTVRSPPLPARARP